MERSGGTGTTPRVVPRIRRGGSGVRNLFAFAGLGVAFIAGALFHFVYDFGVLSLAIAAFAGGAVFLIGEAAYTVTAALLGWPHETRMSVRDALAGLLSGRFW